MTTPTRRQLLTALPLLPAGFVSGTEATGLQDKPEPLVLLRYLAYDRLDRRAAEEERAAQHAVQRAAEACTELNARLQLIPEARAAKEQALTQPHLTAEGANYLRDENTALWQEESALRARLPELETQRAESQRRLTQVQQRREKLAAALTAIEHQFKIEFPD